MWLVGMVDWLPQGGRPRSLNFYILKKRLPKRWNKRNFLGWKVWKKQEAESSSFLQAQTNIRVKYMYIHNKLDITTKWYSFILCSYFWLNQFLEIKGNDNKHIRKSKTEQVASLDSLHGSSTRCYWKLRIDRVTPSTIVHDSLSSCKQHYIEKCFRTRKSFILLVSFKCHAAFFFQFYRGKKGIKRLKGRRRRG